MSDQQHLRFFQSFARAARAFVASESASVRLENGAILYPSQALYLMTIGETGPTGLTDIATTLGVKKPSASQALSRLESLGFVSRAASAEDRRGVHFTLTELGEEAREVLARRHTELVDSFQTIVSQHHDTDLEAYSGLNESLAELFGEDGPGSLERPIHP